MKTICIPVLLTAVALTTGATACEFHAGGFGQGGYGMQWREYDSAELDALIEATYKRQSKTAEQSDAPERKARPTFANAASRAVKAAKSRAESTETDTADDATQSE